jgi:hypothetical protein
MYNGTYRTIIENSGTFHFLTGSVSFTFTFLDSSRHNLKFETRSLPLVGGGLDWVSVSVYASMAESTCHHTRDLIQMYSFRSNTFNALSL